MQPRQRTGGLVGCEPFDRAQARLLVAATPGPAMVADVVGESFDVLAIDPILRRVVTGAAHPAGPRPGELIHASGFGLLGGELVAAIARPDRPARTELPVGDEPSWYELAVTPVVVDGRCVQVLVLGRDRTAEHDVEARQRRSARRLDAMAANSTGLVLLLDSTARVIRSSSASSTMLGIEPQGLLGRQIFELVAPDAIAAAASAFAAVLAAPGEPVMVGELLLTAPEGHSAWCAVTATNLLHDDDVAAIVVNAHDIGERRLAEQQLELAATSDALTGLANRRLLLDRLAVSTAGGPSGLVLVDLDDFGLLNDTDGTEVGDVVLRAVAGRLAALAGDRGTVARIGADEFAIAVDRLDGEHEMHRLADAVHECLRVPVPTADHEVYLRGSVGWASARVGDDAETLMRSADLALGRARRAGGNRTVGWTVGLQVDAERRIRRVTDLQRAVRDGRLAVVYQPVVDARSGEAVGAEALLRWHDGGRLLSPASFLDLAEDTGLIVPIGAWVLDRACRDLAVLTRAVPELSWVSVNVSSRQLLDEQFPTLVQRTMDDHGVVAGRLALEVADVDLIADPLSSTEGLVGADAITVAASVAGSTDATVMVACRDLVADDRVLALLVGVGAAALKLDRSLVGHLDADPDGSHRTLVGAVLELAADLGVDVIAEGVETDAQARVLTDLGCRYLQGFGICEPLEPADLIARSRETAG